MVDLAEMRGIDVDPEARMATAQGGATWADLNEAAGSARPGRHRRRDLHDRRRAPTRWAAGWAG